MRTERTERHWGGGKIISPFYNIKFCALESFFRKAKMRLKENQEGRSSEKLYFEWIKCVLRVYYPNRKI